MACCGRNIGEAWSRQNDPLLGAADTFQWMVWFGEQSYVGGFASYTSAAAAQADAQAVTGGTPVYAAVREVDASGRAVKIVWHSGTPPGYIPADWKPHGLGMPGWVLPALAGGALLSFGTIWLILRHERRTGRPA